MVIAFNNPINPFVNYGSRIAIYEADEPKFIQWVRDIYYAQSQNFPNNKLAELSSRVIEFRGTDNYRYTCKVWGLFQYQICMTAVNGSDERFFIRISWGGYAEWGVARMYAEKIVTTYQ